MDAPQKKRASVVITDLDNTLYDWVEQWYQSFNAMLERLVRISGVSRGQLIQEIKAIHEKYGTSEYAFVIEEMPSLLNKHPNDDLSVVYRDAIDAHREARTRTLKLYPNVRETLLTLKAAGVYIVGYTESLAYYTNYRVRKLGLDGIIDVIYSPADHDLPNGLTKEQVRKYPPGHYTFKHTQHRYTPTGKIKPNPEILLEIVSEIGASSDECIYIGDNLVKDVAMANEAGVTSVHALYGEAHQRESYELLRSVTHWPVAHVENEKKSSTETIRSSYTLYRSFSESLALIDFGALSLEKTKERVKIWERIVDVQKHFNELSLRVRGLAVAVVGAVLTAAALSVKENIVLKFYEVQFNAALPLVGVALATWLAFYVMDHFWYHRLLLGAVKQGLLVEKSLRGTFPEIELATRIGENSIIKVGCFEVHSGHRLAFFYAVGTLMLLAVGYLLYMHNPVGASKPDSKAQVTAPENKEPAAPPKSSK